jgi:serine/threonine protein phosphatase PrpC
MTLPAVTTGLATDIGLVRDHNEDAAGVAGRMFVVADGMGGHAAGEVASRIAADTLLELAEREDLTLHDVVEQVVEANRRIVESARQHREQRGMATTITGVAVVEHEGSQHWGVFNLGDSRVYHLAGGTLNQVTVDHSEVQELVQRGILTPEEAQVHPARNIVTRSLGREPLDGVDAWLLPLGRSDVFVICSDGLSNELTSAEIEVIVLEHPDAQEAAEALVRSAVEAGGRDNVTAVVVVGPADPSTDA